MRTADFLDALRSRYAIPSDYALAPMLGVTRQQVSRYRAQLSAESRMGALFAGLAFPQTRQD